MFLSVRLLAAFVTLLLVMLQDRSRSYSRAGISIWLAIHLIRCICTTKDLEACRSRQ